MESVLYSISFGKQEFHKKTTYQAFSAAISNQDHVDLVLNYICRKDRIRTAKAKVFAYRVNQAMSVRNNTEEDGDDKLNHTQTGSSVDHNTL